MHAEFVRELPISTQWVMAAPEVYPEWAQRTTQILSWDQLPQPERPVENLLVAVGEVTDSLPDSLSQFSSLYRLVVPATLASKLRACHLSRTVRQLDVLGQDSGVFSSELVAHGVEKLYAANVRFRAGSFPSLRRVVARLDSRGVQLRELGLIETLESVSVGPVKERSVFGMLPIGIRYLQLNEGGLASLEGIERLLNLTDVWLNALRKLTRVGSLQYLKRLGELTIANCRSVEDIASLLEIKSLRRLFLWACGPIGFHEVSPRFKERDLEELTVVETE